VGVRPFYTSFDFCNTKFSAGLTIADSSIGCIPPDGRKMDIYMMEGPLNVGGRVAIDMPVNISVNLSMADTKTMEYGGSLNIKLPIPFDGWFKLPNGHFRIREWTAVRLQNDEI
jgi:hypothetical protein